MLSVQSVILPLLISLSPRTISASPVPRHHQRAKRSAKPQNIGSGFAIAICIIILAGVFYYLGKRHERTKSWFKKGPAPTHLEPARKSETLVAGPRHKRQISCPLAVTSSAPIKPYEDLVEAPTASLRCYEMPAKEVYELGPPSPKKPPSTASWLSLDRKPWWLTTSEKEGKRQSTRTTASRGMRTWFRSDSIVSVPEDRSMRTWFRSGSVVSEVEEKEPNASPAISKAAIVDTRQRIKESERKSDGSTLMDWSGLDYMRKIYVARKSRVGL